MDVLRKDVLRVRLAKSGQNGIWQFGTLGSVRYQTKLFQTAPLSATAQWSDDNPDVNTMFFGLTWETLRSITIRGAHVAHLGGLIGGHPVEDKRTWSSTFANFA
jgi:hypothetical protein